MAGTYTPIALDVPVTGEKADILTLISDQRALLKITARNLTDEQARTRSTVSDLTVGGLIKHLARIEREHAQMIRERDEDAELDMDGLADAYTISDGEPLEFWLAEYDRAAADYDQVIAEVLSLDELVPQPTAPWQPKREWWSVRKLALHLLRETAHHCGHADIIREALDGQTTMGAISEGTDWAGDLPE